MIDPRRYVFLPAITVCDGSRPHPARIVGEGEEWGVSCAARWCGWRGLATSLIGAKRAAALHECLQQAIEGGRKGADDCPGEADWAYLATLRPGRPDDRSRDVTGRLLGPVPEPPWPA
jgi:hypothetical protein